jgi:hypothetical protein
MRRQGIPTDARSASRRISYCACGSFEQDRAVQACGGSGHGHPRRVALSAERTESPASIDEAHLAKMAVERPRMISESRLFDRRDADAPADRLRQGLDERWRQHDHAGAPPRSDLLAVPP